MNTVYKDWYRNRMNKTICAAEPVIVWQPVDEAPEIYQVPLEWKDLGDQQILLLVAERLGYTCNQDNSDKDNDLEQSILYYDDDVNCLDIKSVSGEYEATISLDIPQSINSL